MNLCKDDSNDHHKKKAKPKDAVQVIQSGEATLRATVLKEEDGTITAELQHDYPDAAKVGDPFSTDGIPLAKIVARDGRTLTIEAK